MSRLRRINWLAALLWGSVFTSMTSSAVGLITWSWRGIGLTAAATLVLFALLMLAISVFGRD